MRRHLPILILLCAGSPAHADTILLVDTGLSGDGPSVSASQYLEQGWTQTQSEEDVSISVSLYSWTPGSTFDITAYLTTGIGQSATSPALATVSFSAETQSDAPQDFTLFSDLSLGPGTYYVTLSSTDDTGSASGAIWPTACSTGCPEVVTSGITLLEEGFANDVFGAQNSSNPPASNFYALNGLLNFTLTSDPPGSSTPEPSTFAAALSGLGIALCLRLRARRQRRT